MVNIHEAEERGKIEIGWLSSRFSFSFADYFNPGRTGFGKLLVLNDDIIMPGKGFGSHEHENMEIITLVMQGELEHKDSLGNTEILHEGEMQVMSAGRGITHSEYNHSKINKLELFQLWIETARPELTPRHETRAISLNENELKLVVSGNKKDDLLFINQDAAILLGKFSREQIIKYKIDKKRGAFIFIIEGEAEIEGKKLVRRDSIEITGAVEIDIKTKQGLYMMIVDVPM